jgi:hypothetical protein
MSEDLPTGEDPELPDWDEEDEDEIMSELRQIRRDIMAKFNNDFDAYWRYLQARGEEERNRGVRYVKGLVGPFVSSEPDQV